MRNPSTRRDEPEKVDSRDEFLDRLDKMRIAPDSSLHTQIMECHGKLESGRKGEVSWEVRDTGVDAIKTLSIKPDGESPPHHFYMDMADRRFPLLHDDVNVLSGVQTSDVDRLVRAHCRLDHVWFHSGLMMEWARSLGRRFGDEFAGYALLYGGGLYGRNSMLRMEVSGGKTWESRDALHDPEETARLQRPDEVEIHVGLTNSPSSLVERITTRGRFSIYRGGPTEAHLGMVEACKNAYSEVVTNIERSASGTDTREGRGIHKKGAIEVMHPEIQDLGQFVEAVLGDRAFRRTEDSLAHNADQCSMQVLDPHGVRPIRLEITPRTTRIYLDRDNCGNTVLGLFKHLQDRYSAQVRCDGLGLSRSTGTRLASKHLPRQSCAAWRP